MFSPLPQNSNTIIGRPLQFNAAAPINAGLSYLRVFDSGGQGNPFPLFSKYPQSAAWSTFMGNDGVYVSGPVGGGIATSAVLNSGNLNDATNNNGFSISNTGSLAVFTTVGFSADSLNRILLRIGANSGNSYVGIQRFTDNNIYLGWVDGSGTDDEVVANFASFYNVGDPVVIGCSWNSSTTFGYVKGTQVGTHASPGTFPSVINGSWQLNGINAASDQWSRNTSTVIYWVALWDRQLTQQDFAYLQANPFSLFTTPGTNSLPAIKIIPRAVGERYITGSGQGLTWGDAFTTASLNGLTNQLVAGNQIDNSVALDMFCDLCITSTTAQAWNPLSVVDVFLYPLNQDGTTYGNGVLTGTGGPEISNYFVGSILIPNSVSSVTATGTLRGIIMPPGKFKFVIVASGAGSQWPSTGNTMRYRTYNRQIS